jgi:predicted secreted hydrolase
MRNSLFLVLVWILVAASGAADYKQALPGYHYEFPRDHFNHPEYQTEWWYYTGNLKSQDGHRFGFELTFFRQGIARDANRSTWQVEDIYMAHLALSDLSGHQFYHQERVNRAGPGIAGISENTGLIWNGNWQVQLGEARQVLRGVGENFGVELNLTPAKPAVIHGRDGITRKAAGAGRASHYISFTRLITSGAVELHGKSYHVEGTSWMDHEFFSGAMDASESGWDWVSLQLNDGSEIMLYRLRHKDGSLDPYSSGSYIDEQGRCTFLAAGEFTMTPDGETWTSPQTKGVYPIRWRVAIPKLGIDAAISTPLANQEMAVTIGPSYWEGAINIDGKRQGRELQGVGYLEMTGYANGSPGASMVGVRASGGAGRR